MMLKTYNQSNIELDICTVKLRHEDECVKCRFFVVSGDSLALFWMQDIELLNILRITCHTIGGPHESRMFDSQTIQMSNNSNWRTKAPQIKTEKTCISTKKHVRLF